MRELGLRVTDVDVVAEPRRGTDRHSRLLWIELPRMQVHDGWHPVFAVETSDAPAENRVRKQPEVAPAAERQILAHGADGGHGELDEVAAIRQPDPMRKARGVGDAVA